MPNLHEMKRLEEEKISFQEAVERKAKRLALEQMRVQLRYWLSVVGGVLALALLAIQTLPLLGLPTWDGLAPAAIYAVATFAAIATVVYQYLQGARRRTKLDPAAAWPFPTGSRPEDLDDEFFDEEYDHLFHGMVAQGASDSVVGEFAVEDIDEAVRALKGAATAKLLDEFRRKDQRAQSARAIATGRTRLVGRLAAEVADLRKRSSVNLTAGALVTLLGLAALGGFILYGNPGGYRGWDLVLFVLPRVSFVLFIQLFALFFLRLYRSSIQEIKYYQNEISNVESWTLAAEVGVRHAGEQPVWDVMAHLARVERNHLLAKGQTTVELELRRIEEREAAAQLASGTSILKRTLKRAKPRSTGANETSSN